MNRTVDSVSHQHQPIEQKLSLYFFGALLGVAALILVAQQVIAWLQKNAPAIWERIAGWVIAGGIMLILAGVSVVAWKLYKIWISHKREDDRKRLENEVLEQNAQAKQQSVALHREMLLMAQDARVNGDNVDFEYAPDGSIKSFKVIRAQVQRGITVTDLQEHLQKFVETQQQGNQLQLGVGQPSTPKDFAETLQTFRPTQEEIFLSYRQTGEGIYVPLKSLCHVGLVGATGNGKTTMLRMILSQMQHVGAITYMCDPHYTPFDLESGEDWRPIADRLKEAPTTDYDGIKEFLRWYAMDEMKRRLELRRQVRPWGPPIFAAFPEWPAIADAVPEAAAYLALILRQGRKVGVNVIVDTQDLLQATFAPPQRNSKNKYQEDLGEPEEEIPSSPAGAVRKCFRTGIYVGGDQNSAKIILDVKNKVEDEKLRLGKGKLMLRCATIQEATQALAPYPSNESIYALLPYSSTQVAYPAINTQDERPYTVRGSFTSEQYSAQTVALADGFQDDDEDAVVERGYPQHRVVNTGSLVEDERWLGRRVPELPETPRRLPETDEHGQVGKSKEYRLIDAEKPILINLYNKFHSIDECLKVMKKGARYHSDASRILKEAGLL